MKTSKLKFPMKATLALSVIGLAVLAGCGGGGGGGSTNSGGTPPAPDAGNLLTTMPTATYATGSREAEIFAEINAARGVSSGYVKQSAALDKAAASHALYLQTNIIVPVIDPDGVQYTVDGVKMFELGPIFTTVDPTTGILGGHLEVAGNIGFTGVRPTDRTLTAGYVGTSSEVVANEPPVFQQLSQPCVTLFLNTVFHRAALIDPNYSEIGIGLAKRINVIDRTCVISLGAPSANPIKVPDDWKGIYPQDGALNTPRAMWNREAPDPAPEFGVLGSPVSFAVKSQLTVTKFVLTASATGAVVPTKLLTSANSGGYLTTGQAYLVPNGALAKNTKYVAEFVGKSGGKDVSATWSFTTVVSDGRD